MSGRPDCLYFSLARGSRNELDHPPAFTKTIKNRALAQNVFKILMIFLRFFDVNIPFTYRNNVSLVLQKVQEGMPTAAQAKEIVNHMTRAIIDSSPRFECSCCWCPWCLNTVPASIIRCLLCNAQILSVGRFMDQSSLGKPRSLDSEIVIEVTDENSDEVNVSIEPDFEEQEEDVQEAQADIDPRDANVEAIIGDDNLMDDDEAVDEYGEKEDYAEEYLTISNAIAQEPPAICLNTEEIGRTFDELSYVIFQRRGILDEFLSLSFTQMQAKMDDYNTPFSRRHFLCPAIIDLETKLPRAPTKEEYMMWATGGEREQYQQIRNEELIKKRYNPSDSSLLPCENLDICYEVIKIHELMWNIFLRAYTTMNVNDYLTPFVAVNNDGYRELRPSQGPGQRSMISSKVRSLLSNALGIKKYRYVGYPNMPKERMVGGIYHICLEGLFEGQQRRNRVDPEQMYIASQMGLQLGREYQRQFDRVVVKTINGSIKDRKMKGDLDRWKSEARTSTFRQGLLQLSDQVKSGETYAAEFSVDVNSMD